MSRRLKKESTLATGPNAYSKTGKADSEMKPGLPIKPGYGQFLKFESLIATLDIAFVSSQKLPCGLIKK